VAEGMVVKELLTDSMVNAGAALTKKLEENGLPVTTALWLFNPELGEWQLVFGSPDVGAKGPRNVYFRILEAIDQLGESVSAAPFSVITVRPTTDDLVRHLKSAIPTGPELKQVRVKRAYADGRYIEDALIYRAS
jgi:hypothetical protein